MTEQKIVTLHAAAVDELKTKDGNVVPNFALAISAIYLYLQCCNAANENNLSDDNIPSLSWFRFQFWSKNPYTHSPKLHWKVKGCIYYIFTSLF